MYSQALMNAMLLLLLLSSRVNDELASRQRFFCFFGGSGLLYITSTIAGHDFDGWVCMYLKHS